MCVKQTFTNKVEEAAIKVARRLSTVDSRSSEAYSRE